MKRGNHYLSIYLGMALALSACAPAGMKPQSGLAFQTDNSRVLNVSASAITIGTGTALPNPGGNGPSIPVDPNTGNPIANMGGSIQPPPGDGPAWAYDDTFCYALHVYGSYNSMLQRSDATWNNSPSCLAQPNTMGAVYGLISATEGFKIDLPVGGPALIDVVAIRKNPPEPGKISIPGGICGDWQISVIKKDDGFKLQLQSKVNPTVLTEDATQSFDVRFAAGGPRDQKIDLNQVTKVTLYPAVYKNLYYPRYGECNGAPNPLKITSPVVGGEGIVPGRFLSRVNFQGSCEHVPSNAKLILRSRDPATNTTKDVIADCSTGSFDSDALLNASSASSDETLVPIDFVISGSQGENVVQTVKVKQHFCAEEHLEHDSLVISTSNFVPYVAPNTHLFADTWVDANALIDSTKSTGLGTVNAPIKICTLQQLQNMQYRPHQNLYYKLMDDIVATQRQLTALNSGYGFIPIGYASSSTPYANRFIGHFDGSNKTLSGFSIGTTTTDFTGLFSTAGGGFEIKDVNLVALNVMGAEKAGGLVAQAGRGKISNVKISGQVHTYGNDSSKYSSVGGLAAEVCLNGTINGSGEVNCEDEVPLPPATSPNPDPDNGFFATKISVSAMTLTSDHVAGSKVAAGGLFGRAYTPAMASRCKDTCAAGSIIHLMQTHFSGNINALINVGGLIGSHWNSVGLDVQQSSVTDTTLSGTYTGGLVGKFGCTTCVDAGGARASTIADSYFLPKIVVSDSIATQKNEGGLMGYDLGYTEGLNIRNVYADVDITSKNCTPFCLAVGRNADSLTTTGSFFHVAVHDNSTGTSVTTEHVISSLSANTVATFLNLSQQNLAQNGWTFSPNAVGVWLYLGVGKLPILAWEK